ncbi:hypothetical protein H310_13572 [Aphanomyces invadans]|uniref:Protein LTV1 homolog n=1 Tax=Aphanomyces invadans TaxID=157072 RepID=A0A024TFD3_9STRA|nr:hypothetical protein H310_13572 [Aphanomyces invadans]ETV92047.1 hypothetical protein H310_13572 [Aphanomyces invadans]|eukprot:XP_008879344.1 hypothetical protein H310_13572 [Aphanomyces invadans]
MGKKSKSFINKKEAQHFHVVHRSQRDPLINDPEASKFVLLSSKPLPSGRNELDAYDSDDSDLPDLVPQVAAPSGKTVRFGNVVARDLVNELGMVNDGYDYSKHMKEMGQGHFYSAGGTYDEGAGLLNKRVVLPDEVMASANEHDRMLDAITLTEDVMDEDLREALVNDEAFEELTDDFMLQAAQELPDDADGADVAADGFDYDAHIAKLMAAAEGIPKYRGHISDDEDDDEDDDEEGCEYTDEEHEDDGQDKDDAQRALDDAFEKLMAEEYDDEQVGELEEDETRGKLVLEGDLLDQIVDDYVNIRQELMADEGRLGNPLRSGNRLKEILAECAVELADSDDVVMKPTDPVPAVEQPADLSDLSSNPYLVQRIDDQWDCETIVSTYSNLDNHPTVIREPSKAPKKKTKAQKIAESSTIVLSSKTGMPLNIVPLGATAIIPEEVSDDGSDDESTRRKALQLSRSKGKTKEEKKLRKALAKNHKKERREEKKEVKLLYKDEKLRQTQTAGPNLSVFRY